MQKGDVTVHVLYIDEKPIGFVALSAYAINKKPAILVDYLFVSKEYRGKSLAILEEQKASEYLMFYVFRVALDTRKKIGVYYLALYPDRDSESLINFYQSLGFEILKKTKWMVATIDTS